MKKDKDNAYSKYKSDSDSEDNGYMKDIRKNHSVKNRDNEPKSI
jgi:hypothetical protein